MRPDGRVTSTDGAAGEGPGRVDVMAVPTPEHLERVARLLETGTVTIPIQETFSLAQAGDALEALTTRHTQGKLAIAVA